MTDTSELTEKTIHNFVKIWAVFKDSDEGAELLHMKPFHRKVVMRAIREHFKKFSPDILRKRKADGHSRVNDETGETKKKTRHGII